MYVVLGTTVYEQHSFQCQGTLSWHGHQVGMWPKTFAFFCICMQFHMIQSLCVQTISVWKVQSRKKPTYLSAHLLMTSPKLCLPCLIIMQSCYCDFKYTTLSYVLPLDRDQVNRARNAEVLLAFYWEVRVRTGKKWLQKSLRSDHTVCNS